MSDQNLSITDEEVSDFSIKLEEWAKTLPPKEKALLEVLVKTASEAMPEETELPDEELEQVAGGTGFAFFAQSRSILSRVMRPGSEVMDLRHDKTVPGQHMHHRGRPSRR